MATPPRRTGRPFLCLLVLSLPLLVPAPLRADTDLYERVLHSTGWVIIPCGGGAYACGTCCLVDAERRLAVTNRHVVEGFKEVVVYVPVHLQGAFSGLGHGPGDFPVAEAAAASMLSLPLFPHLSEGQIDHVVGVVTAAVS